LRSGKSTLQQDLWHDTISYSFRHKLYSPKQYAQVDKAEYYAVFLTKGLTRVLNGVTTLQANIFAFVMLWWIRIM